MPGYERHIFVCENQRPESHPKGSCAQKGGTAVRARFKQLVAEHGLKSTVRANMAGCLDQCEHGITVVVYPEGVWYGHVTLADVDEIFTRHIQGGEIVERLRLPAQNPATRSAS
jgi:(2Fe-2S) ferredoxin